MKEHTTKHATNGALRLWGWSFGLKGSLDCTNIGVILGLYWGYIGVILGIMEKKMETTIVYWQLEITEWISLLVHFQSTSMIVPKP